MNSALTPGVELQQTAELLRSEQSKTERLQGFLEHAEHEVEQLTNQLDQQKAMITSLEADKVNAARQLGIAKTGRYSLVWILRII